MTITAKPDSQVKIPDAQPPLWALTLFDALDKCTPKQTEKYRAILPYCAQIMVGLRERAVLLNRDYKPLGVVTRDSVYYEDFPDAHVSIELYRLLEARYGSFYFFGGTGDGPWESTKHLRKYRDKIKDLVSPWIDARAWES